MHTPPPLTLIDGPDCYHLAGWEDRKHWARFNDALWSHIFSQGFHHGIQEIDTLKILADAQAAEIVRLRAALKDAELTRPFQITVPADFSLKTLDGAKPL